MMFERAINDPPLFSGVASEEGSKVNHLEDLLQPIF